MEKGKIKDIVAAAIHIEDGGLKGFGVFVMPDGMRIGKEVDPREVKNASLADMYKSAGQVFEGVDQTKFENLPLSAREISGK